MGNYSMPRYFQNMPVVGKPVRANAENVAELKAIEEEIHAQIVKGLENGKADADMNAKGQLTAMQRVSLLVDPGTWCPLNSLYNPEKNKTGTTSIVKGLGRVNGKWCVIIASDNKKHAGTWVPGQADNLLRGSDTAKRLRIPLIYLLECAGVELDQQEKVYPNRRGGGTPFYRNSELNQMGIPVIVGIHGTNPAGGGYHSISPTVLVAHEKANMAVGGAGIVGGMNPKPHVDMEAALAQIEATKGLRADPPGSVSLHFGQRCTTPRRASSPASRSMWICCPAMTWSSSAWMRPSLPPSPTRSCTTWCSTTRTVLMTCTPSSPACSTAASSWSTRRATAPR